MITFDLQAKSVTYDNHIKKLHMIILSNDLSFVQNGLITYDYFVFLKNI